MKLIIENAEELSISDEQAESLLKADLIYLCDVCPNTYHISPDYNWNDIKEALRTDYYGDDYDY